LCSHQATLLFSKAKEDPDLSAESSMTRSINFRYWKRVEADATAIQNSLSVGLQRVGEIRSRLNR
jgi:hypothetical protein